MSVNENPNAYFFTKKYTKVSRRFKRKELNKVKWGKEEEKMKRLTDEYLKGLKDEIPTS